MSPEELLARLVAMPSISGEERGVADEVQHLAESWGCKVQRQANNLWFELGSQGPRLLLNSHIDTVPACEGWSVDPWAAHWRDGRLVGLGANDAKGCVTAMLLAAATFAETPPEWGRLVVAITAEEEIGGEGLATVLDPIGPVDAALVGEPTCLRACIAQRGRLLLRCVARGESGHAAHAVGENAILKTARDALRLDAWEFEPDALLGRTRAVVTKVQGGLQTNQVPDRCELVVDLRTTPNLDHAAVVAALALALESEVEVLSDRHRPTSTRRDHAIVQAALEHAAQPEPTGSATLSDWVWLGDVPTVKIGPGDTLRSHTPDEYLLRDELLAGVAFYRACADSYFRREREQRHSHHG